MEISAFQLYRSDLNDTVLTKYLTSQMLPSSLCVEMVALGLLAFVSKLFATHKILEAYAVRDQTSSLIR